MYSDALGGQSLGLRERMALKGGLEEGRKNPSLVIIWVTKGHILVDIITIIGRYKCK